MLDGFTYGFRIPVVGEHKAYFAQNLKSVRGMEQIVQEKIAKEVKDPLQ